MHKQTTAFTQATYIMPLNCLNFSPWNSDGFTVATWIHMKSANSQPKAKSDGTSDDEDPFREISQEKSPKKEGKVEKVNRLK